VCELLCNWEAKMVLEDVRHGRERILTQAGWCRINQILAAA
jgi:hypothetical protein